MAQTVSSSDSSYCTAAECVQRLDNRSLGDWLADDGTRLTSAQVLASTVLAALLQGASGEFESAIMVGERYTVEDIEALIAADTNAAEFVKDIIANLVLLRAWGRRPRTASEPIPPMAQWADKQLELLRTGTRIFGFAETTDAGKIEHSEMTADEIRRRPLLSNKLRRFFGRRSVADDGGDCGFRE